MSVVCIKKYRPLSLIVLSLLITTSCQEDITDRQSDIYNNIAFTPSTVTVVDDAPQSRVRYSQTPVILYDNTANDTFYLHTSIEENCVLPVLRETRGTPVNTENFSLVCNSFGVTAFVSSGNIYMRDVHVDSYSGDVWLPSDNVRYWPDEETLDFYAYAPYMFNGAVILDTNLSYTANLNKGEISFSYETPKSNNDRDAEVQPDLLFAYSSCSRQTTTNESGTVSLEFGHALAAVKFVAKDIAGGTIRSIAIHNVYGAGDCVSYPASRDFLWKTSGELQNYIQTFNIAVEDRQEGIQDITDANPQTTFMMIPQELGEESLISIVIETKDGKINTLTGTLKGEVWEAGKLYTYAISTESINWIYVFDVTEILTVPHGQTTENYEVNSYRYRAQAPSVVEPLKWSAWEEDNSYKEVVTGFTYNGEGSPAKEVVSYPLSLTLTKMATNWDSNEKTLHENGVKGTTEQPYNLATDNGNILETTANCYIVDAAGTYSLPLVYGNARKNGKDNTAAYSGVKFYDYKNNVISSPYIRNAEDCVLVWSDAFYMFKDVKLSDDRESLIFSIDKNFLQQANAIVAARDADKKIIWSWHIWVTEQNINNVYQLQDYTDGTLNKYGLMPYNLGWIDGKTITYDERTLSFVFKQEKSGIEKVMKVKQDGAVFDYKDGGSVYYQWGRKDPLVALKNRNEIGSDDYRPHEVGDKNYSYRYEAKQVTLGESIQNPNVYYIANDKTVGTHKWLSTPLYYLWDAAWSSSTPNKQTSTKTIYDPSPRGFKVPPPRAFDVFTNGNSTSGTLNGDVLANGYQYRVYPRKNKKGTSFILTATGQRVDRLKDLGAPGGLWAMQGVYYWSCYGNVAADYYGYSLCIRVDANSYTSRFVGAQTMARPVRCIKE